MSGSVTSKRTVPQPQPPVRASMARRLTPLGGQALARRVQVLRQHLHVAEHGHEARVAAPAGHDVQVDVVGDPGARRAAEVPAEVEASGL